ncbi:Bug family tripartite tricarboxylate transporter substrate binding protein [Bordetella genomosp. 10]|nr:tripartite tricarboxylate transporter substrate binding protein [Bordetella genomosp. 10]
MQKKQWRKARAIGLGLCLGFMAMAAPQAAERWPDRPVRIVVPYAAGGTTDFSARLIAQKLSEQTHGSFIVENKAGGSGTIGTLQVVRSEPNGATLLASDTSYAMLPALFAKLPWDHEHDLIPVTTLVQTPVVLVVPSSSPFKTLAELRSYAHDHPGKLNFGSGGAGSSTHLQGALFGKDAGIDITHVPYKGAGEAMMGLVAGQVDVLVTAAPTALPQVSGGRARALAVTGAQRLPALSGVPTFAEAGLPEYAVVNWFGLAAPKGTPPAVIDTIAKDVKRALDDPDLKKRLAEQGAEPGGLSPAAFAARIAKETAAWSDIALSAGITPH